jgi:murein DD-endopeptidase MepM/ murein hydrolase activator NlpD
VNSRSSFLLSRVVISFLLAVVLSADPVGAHGRLTARWQSATPSQGDVAVMFLTGVPDASTVEGSLGGQSLAFFPYGDGYAALAGLDLETKPGKIPWRVGVVDGQGKPIKASGVIRVKPRKFPVQRLTLPKEMVELDPPTLARAEEESKRLKTLFETATPERRWRGRFTRPVGGTEEGTGFGAKRIINGLPRAPHSGADFSADAGTPVVAANSGTVALVAEMFFPGRLVILDHGLGLYTLYFHLQEVQVESGQKVERGEIIGAVGSTGRATGPHLHFGAHLRRARIDPTALLSLSFSD